MQDDLRAADRTDPEEAATTGSTGTVVVAGASGLVGTACVERFAADGRHVVALSRRRPETSPGTSFEHRAVDLHDAAEPPSNSPLTRARRPRAAGGPPPPAPRSRSAGR